MRLAAPFTFLLFASLLFFFSGPAASASAEDDSELTLPVPLYRENSNAKASPDEPVGTIVEDLPSINQGSTIKFDLFGVRSADEIFHRESKIGFVKNLHASGLKFVGAEAARIMGDANWVHFRGIKAAGFIEYQPNPKWNIAASLGGGTLKLEQYLSRQYDITKNIPLWRLRTAFIPIVGTELRLETNDDFAYSGWMDNLGGALIMGVKNYFAEVESTSLPGFRLRSTARISAYRAGNRQYAFDHAILRDIFLSPFSLKAGLVGGWSGYRAQVAEYYSPKKFAEMALRVEAAHSFDRHWDAELRLRLGMHQEKHRAREADRAAEALLAYHQGAKWRVELAGNFFEAGAGSWWRKDLSFKVEKAL